MIAVEDWVERYRRMHLEIQDATLPHGSAGGVVDTRFWVRIALNVADALAGQVKAWDDTQRGCAVQALQMEPDNGGVPSDRYFLRLCRVQALYDILTNTATPYGTPCLEQGTRTWDIADALFSGAVIERVGWAVPASEPVVSALVESITLCRGLPRAYPPEEHAEQAKLFFRASYKSQD